MLSVVYEPVNAVGTGKHLQCEQRNSDFHTIKLAGVYMCTFWQHWL